MPVKNVQSKNLPPYKKKTKNYLTNVVPEHIFSLYLYYKMP